MKQRDTNSIRYPQEVDLKLEKLAQNLHRSKKDIFCQMVDYFYRSKKDPADSGDEILKKDLSSGISRILSFIKQQEKDFLLPLFSDAGLLKAAATRQTELLERIARHLLAESEKTGTIVLHNEHLLKGLKLLLAKQKEKDLLKQQFSELLEYYISQREEMGWATTAIKKEELIAHVRQSLKYL
ncbi:BfmA/BtgA family mobilization protein [Chryseobacterium sp. JM1]|uniref:BfmA/BtgA family mobilization protein n=1 Tax=Chryseobacterium sp. JM1 TaxID=1233950 RepID=UPI0004E77419|nr:BfmA/BtgA family mobilization protein [Chryseobacterium sp. JM1]KFF18842.1 hypothetical protein IW22_16675 [Chryseobacterium sp. JM1]